MNMSKVQIRSIHAPTHSEEKPSTRNDREQPRYKTHRIDTSPIDWLSPDLTAEWETLKSINLKSTQWMIKFYELAKTKSDNQTISRLQMSISDEATKLSLYDHHTDFAKRIKTLTPQLAHNIAKAKQLILKEKNLDREL